MCGGCGSVASYAAAATLLRLLLLRAVSLRDVARAIVWEGGRHVSMRRENDRATGRDTGGIGGLKPQ